MIDAAYPEVIVFGSSKFFDELMPSMLGGSEKNNCCLLLLFLEF